MDNTDPAFPYSEPEAATAEAERLNAMGKGPRVVPMFGIDGLYRLVPNDQLATDYWRETRAIMEAMLKGTCRSR